MKLKLGVYYEPAISPCREHTPHDELARQNFMHSLKVKCLFLRERLDTLEPLAPADGWLSMEEIEVYQPDETIAQVRELEKGRYCACFTGLKRYAHTLGRGAGVKPLLSGHCLHTPMS